MGEEEGFYKARYNKVQSRPIMESLEHRADGRQGQGVHAKSPRIEHDYSVLANGKKAGSMSELRKRLSITLVKDDREDLKSVCCTMGHR